LRRAALLIFSCSDAVGIQEKVSGGSQLAPIPLRGKLPLMRKKGMGASDIESRFFPKIFSFIGAEMVFTEKN
jgi:hypothetical protein